MSDVLVRNVNHFVAVLELHALSDDPLQATPEPTLFADGGSRLELDLAARETLEIGELHEWAFETGGADLEAVAALRKQVLMDVERRRRISAHRSTVFEGNAASHLEPWDLPVDDHADHRSTGLPEVANVDQFDPVRAANRVDELLQRAFELSLSLSQRFTGPQKTKNGRAAAAHPSR